MSAKSVRLNSDTGFLKIIAIAAMLIDHLGAAIFPAQSWMRIVGRLAFPIFAYCIAVGSVYTHSLPKYMLRILLMGLISQPMYVLALNHLTPVMRTLDFSANPIGSAFTWYVESLHYANIMFELALGLAVIWSLQERKYIVTAALVVATWYLNPYLTTSYGWKGVTLMVLFYAFLDQPLTSFVCVGMFMAWWGFYQNSGTSLMSPNMSIQAYALLALLPIYLPTNTGVRLNKWIFYLFYPGHLALIYLIKLFG